MNGGTHASVKAYLRTDGDKVNHVFPIPYDFTGYSCGVMQITGVIALAALPVEEEEEGSGTKKRKKEVPKGSLYLCCDVCEESFVAGVGDQRGRKLPVLRELPNPRKTPTRNVDVPNVLWLDVTTPYVKDIRLYIVNEQGEKPAFKVCDLRCTLLFWKHSK
jgi:hypothetical protein